MPATYATPDIRNLALLGSAASGKTTLAERLLNAAGMIGLPGSSSGKASVSDFTDEEQAHGHSLFTALLHADHQGKHLNLLDTPGSPDFIGQTLTALPAVETGVVVINAAYGIEPMTRRLMDRLAERKLCRMIVINRIDAFRQGIDPAALLTAIRQTFGPRCLPLNLPTDRGRGVIDCFTNTQGESDLGPVSGHHTAIIERVVEVDDALMSLYLEQGDVVSPEQLHAPFEKAMREGHLVPICFTAAQPHDAPEDPVGIRELLDLIVALMPDPTEGNPRPFVKGDPEHPRHLDLDPSHELHANHDPAAPLIAHVFNVRVDPFVGKVAAMRIHQGTLRPGQSLFVDDPREGELRKPIKVSHLLKVQGKKSTECAEAVPGDIIALAKVDGLHWDAVLHDSHDQDNLHLRPLNIPEPMVGLAIRPRRRGDESKIADALVKLQEEDPTFRVSREDTTHETVIHGLGDLHLRIILEKLEKQHHVGVDTAPPSIAYRETIAGKAEGHYRHKKQTGGAGQFGEVYLRVEPLPRGQGFTFVDDTFGGSIPRQFIPAIEKGVRQALARGPVAGFPLQDILVSVHDGKHHAVDSKEIAFVTAGRGAFLDAVGKAGPLLLEPVARVETTAPSEYLGEVTADFATKRGRVVSTDMAGEGRMTVAALVPMAELTHYATQLKSLTSGRGGFALEGAGFEPVPAHLRERVAAGREPALAGA